MNFVHTAALLSVRYGTGDNTVGDRTAVRFKQARNRKLTCAYESEVDMLPDVHFRIA